MIVFVFCLGASSTRFKASNGYKQSHIPQRGSLVRNKRPGSFPTPPIPNLHRLRRSEIGRNFGKVATSESA